LNPYDTIFQAMWGAWCLYWLASAVGTKATARRESALSRLAHLAPVFVAFTLVASPRLPGTLLHLRLLAQEYWRIWFFLGAGLTAAGLALAVWARVHLGRNWSASVTIKRQHELVVSGPYGMVRHPIYSGLLLAFLGTAVALGELRGLLALAIAAASLWPKLKREERFMIEQFGDAYTAYGQRVPALIPHLL
jgi:protein-S-isoprenylcysteine O-methyltransferase Ste14